MSGFLCLIPLLKPDTRDGPTQTDEVSGAAKSHMTPIEKREHRGCVNEVFFKIPFVNDDTSELI